METGQQQPAKSGMKRQRSQREHGGICWATALLVCVATLQSIDTIEYGESFVFVTPPSTSPAAGTKHGRDALYKRNAKRTPSIPSLANTHLGARRKDDSSNDADDSSAPRKPFFAEFSYRLMDHELLTKDQEFELGQKIRKFVETKEQINELMDRKKKEREQRLREIEQRREKEARDRRRRRERAGSSAMDTDMDTQYEPSGVDDDELSMEEELEEYLLSKGINTKAGLGSNSRSSYGTFIEDLYGSIDTEEDEETMMEELGMAIYGIDTYNDDESFSDDLAIVDSLDFNGPESGGGDDDFPVLPESSTSSQLGDTLDDIRLLTEQDIHELGIEGGRQELAQILIQGALAKQKMIKSNVRLVTSIARKWMRNSKNSGLSDRSNADSQYKLSATERMGDWSTPSMDEVIQQGIVGLAMAAERFEPDRKFKFSTYATYYITNEVRQIFQSATTQCLYVPPYFYTIKNKYQKIVRDHYRQTAGDPNKALSVEQIAGMLELKPERLHFILRSTQSLVQLDAPLGTGFTQAGKAGGNDATQYNSDSSIVGTLSS
jgi:DNA-directed RNA polymerase specialized sigma subunit